MSKEEETIFEYLVENFLKRIEKLCKRGISKNYYENEENLPFVRGKVLLRQNLLHNKLLKHRVFCSYSDFGSDNMENRLIKHTLYYIKKRFPEDQTSLLLHVFQQTMYPSYNFYSD